MTRRQLRIVFVGITVLFMVLTLASYPDLSLANIFFAADMVAFLIFLIVWFAPQRRRILANSAPEATEPRDVTTGRFD